MVVEFGVRSAARLMVRSGTDVGVMGSNFALGRAVRFCHTMDLTLCPGGHAHTLALHYSSRHLALSCPVYGDFRVLDFLGVAETSWGAHTFLYCIYSDCCICSPDEGAIALYNFPCYFGTGSNSASLCL